MGEFLELCFSSVNLPFTVLLMMVFAYWILLLVGAVGLETFDLDVDADFDVGGAGGDPTDVDPDFEPGGGGGALFGILRFFNVGDVPLMVLLSFVVFNLWALSILTSYYLNPSLSPWVALMWFLPNLLFSLFAAKFLTMPLKHLFARMKSGIAAPTKIVGQTCVVITSEVTPKFGQAEIAQQGAPLKLNVRTKEGVKLTKGEEALIVARNEDDGSYVIVPCDLEMKNND